MHLLNKLFQYVLLTTSRYNIDESHGLNHAMNSLMFANKIYEKEVVKYPYINDHENIIYVSSVLHDMCDKKYMKQEDGLQDISKFIQSLEKDNEKILSSKESKIVENIVSTMSYSYVKKNGFPNLGKYQVAYNIVREADLLCAYDFDRCMIYQMNKNNGNVSDAYNDAVNLFDVRMFRHMNDGLLLTDYARSNYQYLEHQGRNRMNHWKKILRH